MRFAPVPDDVALTFGSRDGFLLFAPLTVYGSVAIYGSELHPLGFLANTTPAAGEGAALIGGFLLGPA